MAKVINLNGSIRKNLGGGSSKRLRKQGQLPCVIYGADGKNVYVSVSSKDFNKEYLKGNIQIRPIEIDVEGKKYKVLVYQMEIHPVSDMPIHVDFKLLEGKEIKIFVPVEFKNKEKSPGLKRGGFLNIIRRKIQLWCSPESIPGKISVNVGKMDIGNSLKAEVVKFPEGTRPVNKKNFVVVTITGRGKSAEEEKPETEEGAEGVEGAPAAEGAAKPEGSNGEAAKAGEAKNDKEKK